MVKKVIKWPDCCKTCVANQVIMTVGNSGVEYPRRVDCGNQRVAEGEFPYCKNYTEKPEAKNGLC